MKLSVVIQAGGEARRMGQDKALVAFLGQPLIQRVVSRVATAADEVLVTHNQPEKLAFLGLPTFPDLLPARGALTGLYTALTVARFPLVAVVACDMAFASPTLLAAEREALEELSADAVIPQTIFGTEPFHAIYRREICLPAVKAALEAGRKRVDAWFEAVHIYYFSPEQVTRYDPSGEAFININTPEELFQAEDYANGVTRKLQPERSQP